MDDQSLTELGRRLVSVGGVVAVILAGSRARGTHRPDSDVDLGLYYRGSLDVAALRVLAAEVTGQPVDVTDPGGWGPWINGGAWLTIGGQRVDWLYRDLDRLYHIWNECQHGRYEIGIQAGYPLGFYSHYYLGDTALCRILADPSGELAALQAQTRQYPPALGDALVRAMWEADFMLPQAHKGAAGADPTFAAGCLFRAIGVACHALHGHARRWLVHEKGMVASAGRLPSAPPGFADKTHAILGAIGTSTPQIAEAVAQATALIAEVHAVLQQPAA